MSSSLPKDSSVAPTLANVGGADICHDSHQQVTSQETNKDNAADENSYHLISIHWV
jgi:hypothetical protein